MRISDWSQTCALPISPLPTVSGASFASAPVTLSNGIKGTIISFESRTPTEWAATIQGETGPAVTLTAPIFLPVRREKELPAIIMVPGSGNIGTHHLAAAAALHSAGYAVLLLDPFPPPRIPSEHRPVGKRCPRTRPPRSSPH